MPTESLSPPIDVDYFIPHRGTMSLLSRLASVEADEALAEVDITPSSVFARDNGVPAWVGIEYMAQTIAAWAGGRARRAGHAPAVGFLLGSRRYSATLPVFAFGQTLRISARCELIGENGLGQFACHILDSAGHSVAEARVSVFEPPIDGNKPVESQHSNPEEKP